MIRRLLSACSRLARRGYFSGAMRSAVGLQHAVAPGGGADPGGDDPLPILAEVCPRTVELPVMRNEVGSLALEPGRIPLLGAATQMQG